MQGYALHEAQGGLQYHCHPIFTDGKEEPELLSATDTVALVEEAGIDPLCRWQTHLFQWNPFG